ncbi:hypothetical protein BX666DRAFT_2117944 [Dichotomocladium elegans]|nr:hypothetical protein BX666DRAFT_2117944 [Dichotomocladium elegans]
MEPIWVGYLSFSSCRSRKSSLNKSGVDSKFFMQYHTTHTKDTTNNPFHDPRHPCIFQFLPLPCWIYCYALIYRRQIRVLFCSPSKHKRSNPAHSYDKIKL